MESKTSGSSGQKSNHIPGEISAWHRCCPCRATARLHPPPCPAKILLRTLVRFLTGYTTRACLKNGSTPKGRPFCRHTLPVFLAIHPGFCNRRIERLCRIIVHDPSVKRRMAALSALSPPQAGPRVGSLHDMDSCVKPASSGGKISHPWSYFYFSNSAYYFRTERSEVIYAMFCGCAACCGEQNGLN